MKIAQTYARRGGLIHIVDEEREERDVVLVLCPMGHMTRAIVEEGEIDDVTCVQCLTALSMPGPNRGRTIQRPADVPESILRAREKARAAVGVSNPSRKRVRE